MDKEQELEKNTNSPENKIEDNQANIESDNENKDEKNETTAEDKIKELEDKVARAFAEMENQRRRFEKEKEDAFDYGGFSFAKEALSLIDNLNRSKQIL
jgi:molecular chaperone GrpE